MLAAALPEWSMEVLLQDAAIPQQLAQALATRGAVVIRQGLPLDLISRWLPRFQAGFAAADAQFLTGQMPLHLYQNLYQYGHVYPAEIEGYAQWHQELLRYAPFRQLLRHVMGPECALMLQHSYPRRQGRYAEHAIAWHQDAQFLGPLPVVNTWIPLTPAGGDYPGVAFGEPESFVVPVLQPGDLLLFHAFTPHRTHLPTGCQQERISGELRWLKSEAFSQTHSPLQRVNLSEDADFV